MMPSSTAPSSRLCRSGSPVNANDKRLRAQSQAILTGRIFHSRGNHMSPTHANKGGVRYRYYVSRAIAEGRPKEAGDVKRVPAPEIERIVCDALAQHLGPDAMDDADIGLACERFCGLNGRRDDVNRRASPATHRGASRSGLLLTMTLDWSHSDASRRASRAHGNRSSRQSTRTRPRSSPSPLPWSRPAQRRALRGDRGGAGGTEPPSSISSYSRSRSRRDMACRS